MTPTNPYSGREFRLVVEAMQLCTRLERRLIFAGMEEDVILCRVLNQIVTKARDRWLRRQTKLFDLWTKTKVWEESA